MQAEPADKNSDWRRRASVCLDKGQYDLSLNLARERLIAAPEDMRAAIVLCRSWLGLGKLDEAAAALVGIEPLNQELGRLFKSFGDAYRDRKKIPQAVNFYQRSMALLKDMAELRAVQGSLAELLEDDEAPRQERETEEDFQTITMADLYIRQGHYEGAQEILTEILARDPRREEARQRLEKLSALLAEKKFDLPIDKKTAVVHELSQWLHKLYRERSDGG